MNSSQQVVWSMKSGEGEVQVLCEATEQDIRPCWGHIEIIPGTWIAVRQGVGEGRAIQAQKQGI